jgi:nitroreductase
MNTIEAILTRRSIRKYKDTKVSPELVELLLKSAMYAPSARNYQPWHFIVTDSRTILNEIMKVHPYAKMLDKAPLAIVVCGDKNIEPNDGYIAINCSAATQNILLAAHESGLGTVWLGLYPRNERMQAIARLFNLPEEVIPVSLIAVGYPDETIKQPDRFKKDRIHYNKW